MSTYLITGVSRGLGFEFLSQFSQDPANTVVGLVRDKAGTDKKIASELGERKNVHIIQADLSSYDEIKNSVAKTAEVTGGALDYIIANAAFVSVVSRFQSLGDLADKPEVLEKDLIDSFKINVISNVHLFNLYMPLVLKGRVKKVVTLSSGVADIEPIAKYKFDNGAPYAVSKAAMNLIAAKFSAEYSDKGVLFLSISPGVIDTGHNDNLTPEEGRKAMAMMGKFKAYAPHFTGPDTAENAIKAVMSVVNNASVETHAGAFLSHHGNKEWL